MSIAFFCACGKPIKAKDEFAGRKVKCAACGNVVVIPPFSLEKPVGSPPTKPLGAVAQMTALKDEPPPLAQPVVRPPLANPMMRPLVQTQVANDRLAVSPNPWIDQSLTQKSTPWLPGDEERFQKGIKAPRESSAWPIALVVLVLLAGAVTASVFSFGWGPIVR